MRACARAVMRNTGPKLPGRARSRSQWTSASRATRKATRTSGWTAPATRASGSIPAQRRVATTTTTIGRCTRSSWSTTLANRRRSPSRLHVTTARLRALQRPGGDGARARRRGRARNRVRRSEHSHSVGGFRPRGGGGQLRRVPRGGSRRRLRVRRRFSPLGRGAVHHGVPVLSRAAGTVVCQGPSRHARTLWPRTRRATRQRDSSESGCPAWCPRSWPNGSPILCRRRA